MKRLLEREPGDVAEQRLAELVRDAQPFVLNPFRKRQLWVRLTSSERRPTRRPFWVLGSLGGVVLLVGGSAAAALGWLPSMTPASFEEEEAASFGEPSLAATTTSPGADTQEAAALESPEGIEAPATTEGDAATRIVESSPAPGSTSKDARSRRTKAPTTSESGEDPSQVMAAIRAWRSERNAGKARRLLGAYLRDNPRGALAEDALALLIEVAAAQKDPRASDYAKRYLAAYPRGRFRGMAGRVVDAASAR